MCNYYFVKYTFGKLIINYWLIQATSESQKIWNSTFSPLKTDQCSVGFASKHKIEGTTSESTLKPSTSPIFSLTNVLNALSWWDPKRLFIITIKGPTLKTNSCFSRLNKSLVKWNLFLGFITTPQDLDQYVLSAEDGSFYCGICNQASRKKDNLKRHIESKHFPNIFSYQCPVCCISLGTRDALQNHKKRCQPKN